MEEEARTRYLVCKVGVHLHYLYEMKEYLTSIYSTYVYPSRTYDRLTQPYSLQPATSQCDQLTQNNFPKQEIRGILMSSQARHTLMNLVVHSKKILHGKIIKVRFVKKYMHRVYVLNKNKVHITIKCFYLQIDR